MAKRYKSLRGMVRTFSGSRCLRFITKIRENYFVFLFLPLNNSLFFSFFFLFFVLYLTNTWLPRSQFCESMELEGEIFRLNISTMKTEHIKDEIIIIILNFCLIQDKTTRPCLAFHYNIYVLRSISLRA